MIPNVSIAVLTVDTDAELLAATDTIVSGMTGNAAYPTPEPTLAQVGTAKGDFSTAMTAANGGGVQQTAAKNAQRVVLTGLLRNLSAYVQTHCNNDLSTLLSSGFVAQKQRQPAGALPAPDNLRLQRGDVTGQLKARINPVTNARSDQWRSAVSTAPADGQDGGTTTAASKTFEALTPGTIYPHARHHLYCASPSHRQRRPQRLERPRHAHGRVRCGSTKALLVPQRTNSGTRPTGAKAGSKSPPP